MTHFPGLEQAEPPQLTAAVTWQQGIAGHTPTEPQGLAAELIPAGKALSAAREVHLVPTPCLGQAGWGAAACSMRAAPHSCSTSPGKAPRGELENKRQSPAKAAVGAPALLTLNISTPQPAWQPHWGSKVTVLPSLWSHQCQISLSRAQNDFE